MFISNIKEKLKNNESVYGVFINSGTTIACEIAGLAGYDFVLIDSEHGPTGVIDNRELIMAAECRNCAPIVRVSNSSQDLILRTLDVGAHGVMVPQVNDEVKAKDVANAVHYFPKGNRGVANARAADYGFTTPLITYFEKANERNLSIVQCENIKAIPNLEAIAKTEGIDVIFIGPFDLSTTMGQPGKTSYEYIKEVADKVVFFTKKYNKSAGIFLPNTSELSLYKKLGFRFFVIGTDVSMYANACRKTISDIKNA